MFEVSFEEFKAKRDREHEELWRRTQEADKRFMEHPMADFIAQPILGTGNRRQCKDIVEMQFQWQLFVGFLTGLGLSKIRYLTNNTWRRARNYGLRYSFMFAVLSVPWTLLTCPLCQWPNLDGMQLVPQEMRFKHYIDQKYPEMYAKADRLFYDSLPSKENRQKRKELKRQLYQIEADEQKKIDQEIKNLK